jgi:hypothetical protein
MFHNIRCAKPCWVCAHSVRLGERTAAAQKVTSGKAKTSINVPSDKNPIDVKFGVIFDVEASRSIRQAEVGAGKTMIERAEELGRKPKRLVGDTAYGPPRMMNWKSNKGIGPHIPVFDKSKRRSRYLLARRSPPRPDPRCMPLFHGPDSGDDPATREWRDYADLFWLEGATVMAASSERSSVRVPLSQDPARQSRARLGCCTIACGHRRL